MNELPRVRPCHYRPDYSLGSVLVPDVLSALSCFLRAWTMNIGFSPTDPQRG